MELLKQLYSIHSMSGQEGAMRKFVKNYVKQNIEGAVVRQDHGNLYIVKGESDTYPCVVAHLDQVQTKHSPDFRVFEHGDILFAYSAMSGRQEGLGADDKNGIWVALRCLERFDVIKVALFKEEEIGCGGSMIADMDFFSDVRFCIQADRRNGGDLITDICGSICSAEFKEAIMPYAKARGYKETSGMMTDVETLADNGIGVSCINMSCGYYHPHTDEEYTDWKELLNCLSLVVEIIANCTDVYPHKRAKIVYGEWGGFGSKSPLSWYDDDYYNKYGIPTSYKPVSQERKVEDEDGVLWDDDIPDANDLFIPDFKDYEDPEDAVMDFIWQNDQAGYDAYRIYDFISADCETYGIDYDYYCQLVDYTLDKVF